MDVGMQVTAEDEWYGSYTGEVVGFRARYGSGTRVMVRIDSCIRQPSDRAILNPDARYHREPFPTGSIQHFALTSVSEIKCPNAC